MIPKHLVDDSPFLWQYHLPNFGAHLSVGSLKMFMSRVGHTWFNVSTGHFLRNLVFVLMDAFELGRFGTVDDNFLIFFNRRAARKSLSPVLNCMRLLAAQRKCIETKHL